MKKPCVSQLWLFVVQQAEAAALSLGFSLSKVLVRFAAHTYFAACRPHISAPPPPSPSPHPSNHHPSPLHLLPLASLSLSLCSLCCRCFGYVFLVRKQTAKCRQNAPRTSPAVAGAAAAVLANSW